MPPFLCWRRYFSATWWNLFVGCTHERSYSKCNSGWRSPTAWRSSWRWSVKYSAL